MNKCTDDLKGLSEKAKKSFEKSQQDLKEISERLAVLMESYSAFSDLVNLKVNKKITFEICIDGKDVERTFKRIK